MPSPLIPLESIHIASPCRADWNASQRVQNTDCIRFCPSCGKNVYDLSGFTRDAAMRLIEDKEGNLCLRLHRRSDGTVITSDCPVGKSSSRKRSRIAQWSIAFVGLGSALLGLRSTLFNRHAPEPAVRSKQSVKPLSVYSPSLATTSAEAIRNTRFVVIPEDPAVEKLMPSASQSFVPPEPQQSDPISFQQSGPFDGVTVTMGAPPPPEPTATPISAPPL